VILALQQALQKIQFALYKREEKYGPNCQIQLTYKDILNPVSLSA
jgi:hypothetical protein